MRHFSLIIASVLVMTVGLTACQTIQFERPHVLSETDWPTDGGATDRSRFSDGELNGSLEMAWEYSANAGFGPGSALLLQDRVLVATRKGEVHTIELETGRGRGFKRMGEAIEATPLIHQGLLFVPTSWGEKSLVAFDLTKGVISWRYRGVPFETSLIAYGESIVGVDVEGNVRAHNAQTGILEWEHALGDRVSVSASPVQPDEDTMIIVTDKGMVHQFNLADHALQWSASAGDPVMTTPNVSGDHLFLSTTRGRLVAMDLRNQSIRWTFDVQRADARIGAVAATEDVIVFGDTGGTIRGLDPHDASLRWSLQLDDVATSAPQIVGDRVFVGTLGKQLLALSLDDGQVQWQTEMKGRIKSAMAVSDAGLIVLSEPKWVTLFSTSPESSEES